MAETRDRTGSMKRPVVAPGTVELFSDIACPWATVAVTRFRAARDRAGAAAQTPSRARSRGGGEG